MKIAVFDFDGTLYQRDSLIDFCLYIYKKRPLRTFFLPYQIFYIALYKAGIVSRMTMKTAFLVFLYKINESELNNYLTRFWQKRFPAEFNRELLTRIERLNKEGVLTMILSASPEIFITPLENLLKVHEIKGSKVLYKNNRYFYETDNRGVEKMNYFRQYYPEAILTEAYSDNKDDMPLLQTAEKGCFVKKNHVLKVKT